MRYLMVLFMICILHDFTVAQGFKGSLILGVNAAQIDGDSLYGFNKGGISVGGRLSYTNDKSWDVCMEMLYSQRGSAIEFFTSNENWKNSLNYLEIPVIFHLKDWYSDKDEYYKVRAESGISYGYLFQVKSPVFDEEIFKKHDVSWLVGVGYNFNKHLGIGIRYTSSFTKVVDNDISQFHSYFLTIRTEYTF
ncbi:MAG: porin family protein [Saprospiraceae bacterium]